MPGTGETGLDSIGISLGFLKCSYSRKHHIHLESESLGRSGGLGKLFASVFAKQNESNA